MRRIKTVSKGQRDKAQAKAGKLPDAPIEVDSFESPESTQVQRANYNPETQTLYIDFKDKDGLFKSSYRYSNFPMSLWEEFKAAPSKGSFLAEEIIVDRANPKYRGVKL